jgi:Lysine methyltransferase
LRVYPLRNQSVKNLLQPIKRNEVVMTKEISEEETSSAVSSRLEIQNDIDRDRNIDDNSNYDEEDHDDSNDIYLQMIQFRSIRNHDGLETAIEVQWQDDETTKMHLSTKLQEGDLAPLFDGAQWAGTRVWNAAIAMIQYVVSSYHNNHDDCHHILSQQRNNNNHHHPTDSSNPPILLELGCGLGVPGMILHALYGCETYLTDQESILSQLEYNIQANQNHDKDHCNIHALPLTWTPDDPLLQRHNFTMVINCDCIYEPLYGDSWKSLVSVLDTILAKSPDTIVLTSVERRTADGIDLFLHNLENSPHVSHVMRVWQDEDYHIEIYQAYGLMAQSKEEKC